MQGRDPVTLGAGVVTGIERRPARDPGEFSRQQLEPFPDLLRVRTPGKQLGDHPELGVHQPSDTVTTKPIVHQT